MPHRCGTPEVGNHKWYLTYTCTKNSTHFICVIVKWLATKSPFYFPSLLLLPRSIGSNWKPPTNHPQGHQIFSKVPIVTFELANSKAIKHNPTLSDSVFKVTRIIDAKNIQLHQAFFYNTTWYLRRGNILPALEFFAWVSSFFFEFWYFYWILSLIHSIFLQFFKTFQYFW